MARILEVARTRGLASVMSECFRLAMGGFGRRIHVLRLLGLTALVASCHSREDGVDIKCQANEADTGRKYGCLGLPNQDAGVGSSVYPVGCEVA